MSLGKPAYMAFPSVALAIAVTMPSGVPVVVEARDRLLRESVGNSSPRPHGRGGGLARAGPLVHHGLMVNENKHAIYVGNVSDVSDISIFTCPFQAHMYCHHEAWEYLQARADAVDFIERIADKMLVCDCSLGYGECWAWLLHEFYHLCFPEASVRFCGYLDANGVVQASPNGCAADADSSAQDMNPRAADVTSGGLQSKRSRLPQLVPDGLEPEEHLRRALAVQHPMASVEPSTVHVRRALRWSSMHADALIERRTKACDALQHLASCTADEDARIRQLAAREVGVVLNSYAPKCIAFMREVSFVCQSSDNEAPLRLFLGLPMLGWAPRANGMMDRVTPPDETIEQWTSRRVERNSKLLARIGPSGDVDLDQQAYDKTLQEVRAGPMIGPFMNLQSVPVTEPSIAPRHGIWECHGESIAPSVRNIDDLLMGEQNLTAGTVSAHRPTDVDALVAQTRAAATAFGTSKLAAWCSDFSKAFKQIPGVPSQMHHVVVAQWSPVFLQAVFFLCMCQLFGSKSAPLNFSRYPTWCCEVMAFIFAVPMTHCVDDMISVEREDTAASARQAWLLFAELCGWLVSMEKSPPPSALLNVIGVILDLRSFPAGEIFVRISNKRVTTITDTISMILKEGVLGCGQAASLAGKLGFTISATFGKVGRARIGLIAKRAYSRHRKLSTALRRTLQWWLYFMRLYKPRQVPTHALSLPTLISYSDGEGGYAGIGVAVWASWLPRPLAAFTRVPDKIRTMWATMAEKSDYKDIYLIEGIGPLILLYAFPKVMRSALWVHFVDNEAAEAALVKGASSLHAADHIVGLTWDRCAQRNLIPYFDRVESSANPVDRLSRGVMDGPWFEVVQVSFPTNDLERMAEQCGGWFLTAS